MSYEKINSMEGREVELKKIAADNFSAWNQALLSLDASTVASLYSEDASFLPTLNPELKSGQKGAEEYFKHFLEKKPEGEIIEDTVQEIAVDENGNVSSFLHSGLYDFEVGTADQRQKVAARFTFLWQKDAAGTWKIKHHHSSLKPVE